MNQQACDICGVGLVFRWTDTHGVGVCTHCGAPYTIYHYHPETKERLEKPPELALSESGKTLAARYWTERKAMVFPAAYDMGYSSRRDTTYSGATREDERSFHDWLRQQPESQDAGAGQ